MFQKWAVPLDFGLSALDPAFIQTPTVAVFVPGIDSLATVNPLGKIDVW